MAEELASHRAALLRTEYETIANLVISSHGRQIGGIYIVPHSSAGLGKPR